jgi:hypothetical protein
MSNKEHIREELKQIAPILALSQNKAEGYIIPDGYFSTIEEKVWARRLSNEYIAPDGYFDQMRTEVWNKLKEEESITDGIDDRSNKPLARTNSLKWMTGIAASLLLLIYVGISTGDSELSTDVSEMDLSSEYNNYFEDNIDDIELDELLAFNDEGWDDTSDEEVWDSGVEEEYLEEYLEENILLLEDDLLTELLETD